MTHAWPTAGSAPTDLGATRAVLQRVATHVLARARYQACGRFGLRAAPGGIATPAFSVGGDVVIVRIAAGRLHVERGSRTVTADLAGSTLARLADVAGADLTVPFDAGDDTVALGDLAEVLAVDPVALDVLAWWYAFGASVLDEVVAGMGPTAEASVVQLWPEHFDLGVDVAVMPGARSNLGASPGDAHLDEPYFYVGPWDSARPGDDAYWNAPFGAVLPLSAVREGADPVSFLRRGIELQRLHGD